jgi:hypothetical protein
MPPQNDPDASSKRPGFARKFFIKVKNSVNAMRQYKFKPVADVMAFLQKILVEEFPKLLAKFTTKQPLKVLRSSPRPKDIARE